MTPEEQEAERRRIGDATRARWKAMTPEEQKAERQRFSDINRARREAPVNRDEANATATQSLVSCA